MTLCPIALMSGCKKCMVVDFCLLKTVIGDYKKEDEPQAPKKEGGAQH